MGKMREHEKSSIAPGVIIEVKGGVIQNIRATDKIDVYVVDYDNLNGGDPDHWAEDTASPLPVGCLLAAGTVGQEVSSLIQKALRV